MSRSALIPKLISAVVPICEDEPNCTDTHSAFLSLHGVGHAHLDLLNKRDEKPIKLLIMHPDMHIQRVESNISDAAVSIGEVEPNCTDFDSALLSLRGAGHAHLDLLNKMHNRDETHQTLNNAPGHAHTKS